MGLAATTNWNQFGKLHDILARLRDERFEKIATFRRDQSQAVPSVAGDELDVARTTAEVETNASLLERSADHIRLIDQALARFDDGTYGICAACGEDIPLERLKVLPFALLCVDCQQRRGKSRGRLRADGTIESYSSTWTPPTDMEAENREPNSYGVIEAANTHAEDPFGPVEEPTGEEPKRRRGRPRKNKD
jgi:DnaK suppressor protein